MIFEAMDGRLPEQATSTPPKPSPAAESDTRSPRESVRSQEDPYRITKRSISDFGRRVPRRKSEAPALVISTKRTGAQGQHHDFIPVRYPGHHRDPPIADLPGQCPNLGLHSGPARGKDHPTSTQDSLPVAQTRPHHPDHPGPGVSAHQSDRRLTCLSQRRRPQYPLTQHH